MLEIIDRIERELGPEDERTAKDAANAAVRLAIEAKKVTAEACERWKLEKEQIETLLRNARAMANKAIEMVWETIPTNEPVETVTVHIPANLDE